VGNSGHGFQLLLIAGIIHIFYFCGCIFLRFWQTCGLILFAFHFYSLKFPKKIIFIFFKLFKNKVALWLLYFEYIQIHSNAFKYTIKTIKYIQIYTMNTFKYFQIYYTYIQMHSNTLLKHSNTLCIHLDIFKYTMNIMNTFKYIINRFKCIENIQVLWCLFKYIYLLLPPSQIT
jgi:hypothetical protein